MEKISEFMSQENVSANDLTRLNSGHFDSDSKLVLFLYLLMRDHLPAGVVAELYRNIGDGTFAFTNGWLAKYAEYIASSLVGDK